MHGNRLFDQTKEEHASMRRPAPVKPECKFVQICLQMLLFERSLVRTHQPALNERCDPMYTRQYLVSLFTGTLYGGSVMDVFIFGCTWIGWQPVCIDRRAWLDVLLNKEFQCFGVGVGDDLQAAAPKPFWGEQFHGNGHQHLALSAAPAFAVPHSSEYGFVNFHIPRQHIVSRMTDCAPKPVKHRPSCLIGAKSENSMQRFGGNAIFSGGQVPSGGKPNSKGRSGTMENCARRGRYSIAARITPPSPVLHAPTLGAVARWAREATLTSNPVQIVETGIIVVKPCQKLGVIARVVNPRIGRDRTHFRCAW